MKRAPEAFGDTERFVVPSQVNSDWLMDLGEWYGPGVESFQLRICV